MKRPWLLSHVGFSGGAPARTQNTLRFANPPCGRKESPSSPRAFLLKRLVPPGPGDTEMGFREQAGWRPG